MSSVSFSRAEAAKWAYQMGAAVLPIVADVVARKLLSSFPKVRRAAPLLAGIVALIAVPQQPTQKLISIGLYIAYNAIALLWNRKKPIPEQTITLPNPLPTPTPAAAATPPEPTTPIAPLAAPLVTVNNLADGLLAAKRAVDRGTSGTIQFEQGGSLEVTSSPSPQKVNGDLKEADARTQKYRNYDDQLNSLVKIAKNNTQSGKNSITVKRKIKGAPRFQISFIDSHVFKFPPDRIRLLQAQGYKVSDRTVFVWMNFENKENPNKVFPFNFFPLSMFDFLQNGNKQFTMEIKDTDEEFKFPFEKNGLNTLLTFIERMRKCHNLPIEMMGNAMSLSADAEADQVKEDINRAIELKSNRASYLIPLK